MPDTILSTKDIARLIAQKLDLPPATADAFLKEFQHAIIDQLSEGGEVRMTGFGTFKTVNREAREARNPRTGEVIQVPGQAVVRFVPGKNLKELNGGSQ